MLSSTGSAWHMPLVFVLLAFVMSSCFNVGAASPLRKRADKSAEVLQMEKDLDAAFDMMFGLDVPEGTEPMTEAEKPAFRRVVSVVSEAIGRRELDPNLFVVGDLNADTIMELALNRFAEQNQGERYERTVGFGDKRPPNARFVAGFHDAQSIIGSIRDSEDDDESVTDETRMPDKPTGGFKERVQGVMKAWSSSRIRKFLINGTPEEQKALKERGKELQAEYYTTLIPKIRRKFSWLFGKPNKKQQAVLDAAGGRDVHEMFSKLVNNAVNNYKNDNYEIYAVVAKVKGALKKTFRSNQVAKVFKVGSGDEIVPPADEDYGIDEGSDTFSRMKGERKWSGKLKAFFGLDKTGIATLAKNQEKPAPIREVMKGGSDGNVPSFDNPKDFFILHDERVFHYDSDKYYEADPKTGRLRLAASQADPDLLAMAEETRAWSAALDAEAAKRNKNPKSQTGPTGTGPGEPEGGPSPGDGPHLPDAPGKPKTVKAPTGPGKGPPTAPKGPPKGAPKSPPKLPPPPPRVHV